MSRAGGSDRRAVRLCYCETVKNITLSIPDDVYRQARVLAAQSGTSVSALVATQLRAMTDRDAEFDRLAELQRRVLASIDVFSGADRLDREALHERALR